MSYYLWSATDDPKKPRNSHVAVRLHNGKVLIAGGSGSPATKILAAAEMHNPDTGTESAFGNLSGAHTRL